MRTEQEMIEEMERLQIAKKEIEKIVENCSKDMIWVSINSRYWTIRWMLEEE